MSDHPPLPDLDVERFRLLIDLFPDADLAQVELVEPFVTSCTELLAKAEDARARDDAQTLQKAIHDIKGSALNLGAEALGQHAAALLAVLRSGRMPETPRILELKPLYDRACVALMAAARPR